MTEIHFPPAVRQTISLLREAGFAAYAAGGCVRDSLLSRQPGDWDIATSARPDEMRRVFAGFRLIPTGEKHGTLTVLVEGMPLEITAFRVEEGYSDGRHPDAVRFTTALREDLSRRDFTINAMAAAPGEALADPFGGREDLKNRLIRCVGDPVRRFSEDALRMLRALRFASVLGFSIHPETAAAIRQCRAGLAHVSAERITAELKKLLCGENVLSVLLDYSWLFAELIPALAPCIGFLQRTPYHLWDVYEHTARAVAAVRPDPVLRLTMLLHDIGKPGCFFAGPDGVGHFKGHPTESARLAAGILREMRLPSAETRRILTLIRYHDATIRPEEVQFWLSKLGKDAFFDLLEIKEADNAAKNRAYSDRAPLYARLREEAERLLSENACLSLSDLALKGGDLLAAGYRGREVGRMLDELLYQVVTGRCANSRAALLARIPALRLPAEAPRCTDGCIFRRAEMADLDAAEALYFAVTERLARTPDNLCPGWRTGVYPARDTAEDAIARGELYLLDAGCGPGFPAVGTAILNREQPAAYRDVEWTVPGEVFVLHTLAVHPDCRGGKLARELLRRCEEEVRRLGGTVIRLDARAGNQPATSLYEGAGYRHAGTVDLGLNIPGARWFRVYEKRV